MLGHVSKGSDEIMVTLDQRCKPEVGKEQSSEPLQNEYKEIYVYMEYPKLNTNITTGVSVEFDVELAFILTFHVI